MFDRAEWAGARLLTAAALFVVLVFPELTYAQDDSLAVFEHEAIIVTAKRSPAPLRTSVAATSLLKIDGMDGMPVENLADLLQTMPGLSFVDRDGVGADPVPTVRGFYGGGEVEYLVVTVDRVPVNHVETGLVNWDVLRSEDVESIELVRGGASSLYGDAAIGGVLNIRTAPTTGPSGSLSASLGGYGTGRAAGAWRSLFGDRRVGIAGSFSRTDGFREHGERTVGSVNGFVDLLSSDMHTLKLRTENNWRDIQDPGYLPSDDIEADAAQSMPFFRFDGTNEDVYQGALDGEWRPWGPWEINYTVAGDYRKADVVRTVLLIPEFADTKQRLLTTKRISGSAQTRRPFSMRRLSGTVQIGLDASRSETDSRYFDFFRGGPADYRSSSGDINPVLDEAGDGKRSFIAAYGQLELMPTDRLLLSVGGRIDHIADSFDPETAGIVAASSIDHTRFSPKAGFNYGYATGQAAGNVYASVSRSFKAPTLDQRYDQRTIPVDFEPYKISLSNAGLRPQYGVQYEAGGYQRIPLSASSVAAEVSLAIYRIDLRDELDFSIEEFRYVNIGRSRHDGVEIGLKLAGPYLTGFVSYALQEATQRVGSYSGKRLKAIPKHTYSAGVQTRRFEGASLGVKISGAADTYLDDANTIRLPDYRRLDVGLSYRSGDVEVGLDVFNVIDASYSTNGFPDAAGFGVLYLYPAAARRLQVGVSVNL